MNRYFASALLASWFACALPCDAAATPKQVDDAISRGVQFLYSKQHDSNWEIVAKAQTGKDLTAGDVRGSQWGGVSALCTFALLAAGENPQDGRILKAIDWLRAADLDGTYAVGVRMQVWMRVPPTPQTKLLIRRDAEFMMRAMKTEGPGRGLYFYTADPKQKEYDHSASQFAVLGAWAGVHGGYEIPRTYWQEVDRAWRAHQNDDGSWAYQFKGTGWDTEPRPSMTAAGIATLLITQEFLQAAGGAQCKGNIVDANIDKGMELLGSQMNQISQKIIKNDDLWRYYMLYGLARIGIAGGFKYIGTADWYQLGADYLVKNQGKDGSWKCYDGADGALHSTAFAVLFLARGRAPVAMNKLQYELVPEGGVREGEAPAEPSSAKNPARREPRPPGEGKLAHWNQRPQDVASVSRWMGRQIERELNWQVVSLKVPVEELHDAPILYIAGDQSLEFADTDVAKLRRFVEEGGLILGNADCGNKAFADSFRKLGGKLFPMYEFRELPAEHVIYTNQQFPRSKWKNPPAVLGLSNGARELMLLVPQADLAKAWQTQNVAGNEFAYQVAADIFQYAVDKQNLQTKGESYLVRADSSIKPNRTAKVARLQYQGNWDPEPAGWKRLAAILLNQFKANLVVDAIKLGDGKLNSQYNVAHITGTDPFQLSEAQRGELKNFIQQGGTLVIDAAGGSSAFSKSAETEIAAMFPDIGLLQIKEPLPVDHKYFSVRADKHATVAYRRAAQDIVGKSKSPRLRGIEMNNRIAVFYSPEDISVGLVGQPVDGIVGYDPKSAADCMTSMVLYAASQKK